MSTPGVINCKLESGNNTCIENRTAILPDWKEWTNLCSDSIGAIELCPDPPAPRTAFGVPAGVVCICVLPKPTGSTTISSTPITSPTLSSSNSMSSPTPTMGNSVSQSQSTMLNSTQTATAASSSTTPASNASSTRTSSSLAATSTPRPQKNKISTGAAAGIGTGCAFAGALIAGVLLFFLFRRKRQAKHASIHPYPDVGYLPEGKIPMGATSSSTRGGAVSNIDRLLPQPAEDDAIIGAISRIRDGIKNHVQNYYHHAAVRPELVDETEVFELAQATGMAAATVRNLFLNPSTRIAAIRLYLAQLILSSCEGQYDSHASFLPHEISALAASLSTTENTKIAQPALYSKWKTITGALLQRQYGQALGEHDTRNQSVNRVMETAESVLRPFQDPGVDVQARRRNLEGTIKRAAQLAFVLFSQPASFHFDYSGTGQTDRLLVFPALLQIVSDEAEVLSPPRVLGEPEELDVGAGF